ncbi:MAG: hypothetical protein NT023_20320 [Armatimonadetes bacterium]|nr:hypothetical protein [Armatimonadota bacterium]
MRAEFDRLKANGTIRNIATEGDGTTHSDTFVNLQLCPMSSFARCRSRQKWRRRWGG